MLDALRFTFAYWKRQPWLTVLAASAMIAATLADVVTPVFAGRLVGAAAGPSHAALPAALAALASLLGLAAAGILARHVAFRSTATR